jgi:hypothetical protein
LSLARVERARVVDLGEPAADVVAQLHRLQGGRARSRQAHLFLFELAQFIACLPASKKVFGSFLQFGLYYFFSESASFLYSSPGKLGN